MRDNPLLENQNILYDLDYLLDFGVEPGGINFDPMTAMNVAYPEFDKGLDFTTMLYTFYPYYKDEGKTWNKKEPDEKTFTYNCKDMVSTPKVSQAVRRDLTEGGLISTYENRVRRFLPIGLEMQRNRLRLDREWHGRLAAFLKTERERRQAELDQLVGRPINVKSTPAVATLLYEELRLPVKHKRGTDSVTTDEDTLRELRASHPNVPQLNLILQIRHLRTKESNYINVDFDIDPDGEHYLGYMARVSFAKTGRWSFSQSPKWRGSSPQTVPKIMRLMYCPPPGSVFWQRDLSQAEARIVAWLSNCRFLLNVFASPIKIHKVVGGGIFRKRPEDIESDSIEYDVSKRIVHAYNYMMAYKKLAITANIPLDFARYTYDNYGIQVPEISEWHRSIKQLACIKGCLVTPMGRVRQLYKACGALAHTGQLPDEIWRDLVSYIPQATVPDILNEAMFELWDNLPWVKFHQQGHDSYLASGPPNRTQEFMERAEAAADRVRFTINGRDCHIPGEFQWGYSWGAMLNYKVGEDTTYEAWLDRATKEGFFKEDKIKERLYSMI
jgi:DNA polymerase I-like protein with 3'-5' exonuclease and polymerase domains